ncbi:hypothetical protein DOTSEDRAFT_70317 [Dothistroma septosporum NZE10]|uniref:Alpha-acetolactate decarboxylase n=1 Tax=Dothistroma septosporum (strain NZE10 / CBS 128990) TaxID=675120 RepID=N1PV98_DOTSN|nr:hypothetical protein DOTSEDRAFT_70317 [Dothistroma septosporum NZE10]
MAVKSIPNDIFQYSLHAAWQAGLRDGGPPVAFLTNHGNHGIGYFDDEESDMIQIDSIAYSISPSGAVAPADKEEQLPHVLVTIFHPNKRAKCPAGTTSKDIKARFEDSKNTPMPFSIKGAWKYINTQQATYWDVKGTIFGFAIPRWQRSVSGDGLVCGFLSDDKKQGGRVIDFETGSETTVEWAKCGRFHLGFPQDEEFEELRL